MKKKTIGEILRLARVNQDMTLEDIHEKTDIQMKMLVAMEADDFDQLPSPFYARAFLRKYAWAVDLDENILLDAYEDGSMITYDEVEVDDDFDGRRVRKNKSSFLPIFYFTLVSLGVLAFVTYYVWSYTSQQPKAQASSETYQVVSSSSSTKDSSSTSSSTSQSSSEPKKSTVKVTGGETNLTANFTSSAQTVKLKLTVTDVTSWISVTDTALAGGEILSPDNKEVEVDLTNSQTYVLTLGVVKGVEVSLDGQALDTSSLTSRTGNITIQLEEGTS